MLQVPFSYQILEAKIEGMIIKGAGKDKLSMLFLVIRNDEEADFLKELPDKMIRDLKMNLNTREFHKECHAAEDNLIWNYTKFESEISKLVDTNKIRVFFSKSAPKSAILSKRVFNYPNISLPSTRPFKPIGESASHISKPIQEIEDIYSTIESKYKKVKESGNN